MCLVDIVPVTIWTVLESSVTIMSACLIVSRPWLLKLYPEKLTRLIREGSSTRGKAPDPSSGRKRLFSTSARLTDRPPAVTNILMGKPFELDVEKNLVAKAKAGSS